MHVLVNLVPSANAVDVFFGPKFLTTLSPGPSLPPLADAPATTGAFSSIVPHEPQSGQRPSHLGET